MAVVELMHNPETYTWFLKASFSFSFPDIADLRSRTIMSYDRRLTYESLSGWYREDVAEDVVVAVAAAVAVAEVGVAPDAKY